MDEEEIREDGAEEVTEDADEAEEVTEGEDGAEEDALDDDLEEVQVETATYEITGLVDIYDEQMNITGQFPIGSVQELPVEVGDKAVEEGNATRVEASTAE